MRALRLYLTALLALAYLIAWWAFGLRAPHPAASTALAPAMVPARPEEVRSAIWYGDLPPTRRPPIRLPSGWYLAPPAGTSVQAEDEIPLVPTRVAPARPGRVRTRSS